MHSKPMPEDMRRGIYEETGSDFSGTICAGAAIDDLDEAAVENFRAKWIEKSEKNSLPCNQKNGFSMIAVRSRMKALRMQH